MSKLAGAAVALLASSTCYAQTTPAGDQAGTQGSAPPVGAVAGTAPAAATPNTGAVAEATGNDQAEIVVTGFRRSLANAANLKRNSSQIQDSIVAEDVGKLPDTNIAETLQRIPGVQLTRNARGEGNGFSIHGLTLNKTLLNGRDIFQTSGRVAALLDFPADVLAGIDVYKTETSDQIEGGLGGLVNIRTARPFDHDGSYAVIAASGNYSVYRDRVLPRLIASASNRWDTGLGEMGLLIGATYEQIYTAAYDVNATPYTSRTLTGSSATALVPGQIQSRYTFGERTRFTTNGAFQWKPSDNLAVNIDGLYAYSNGRAFVRSLAGQLSSATGVTAQTNGTSGSVPASATFTGTPLTSSATGAINPYRTMQFAGQIVWTSGHLTVTPEVSYTKSAGLYYSHATTFASTAPSLKTSLGSATPDFTVSGVNLQDANAYRYVSFLDTKSFSGGREPAAKVDLRYSFDDSPIKAILAGVRYSSHKTRNDNYTITYPGSAYPLNQSVGSVLGNAPDPLFGSAPIYQTASAAYVRNLDAARNLIGISTQDPAYDPLSHFVVKETVLAGYGQVQFDFADFLVPIDGNVGVRVIDTTSKPTSYQSTNGVITPVNGRNQYTNVLPSINLRAKITPDVFLRGAFSKAIYRPDYSALNPFVGISPNLQTGSAGNPDLQPVRADQYDLSLEYYFGKSNLLAGSLFRKDVTGFIQSFSLPEAVQGVTYQVSRPRNGGNGRIQGFELNYTQFFDFLPGLLNGLGIQANYTYVDTKIQVVGLTGTRPAQGVSKYSYNITGVYEKGPVSVRLSYNRRGRYVDITSADAAGNILWVAPLNSLDLSSTLAINRRLSLKFDAVNLTGQTRYEYYGNPALPQIANKFDRSFEAGIRYRF